MKKIKRVLSVLLVIAMLVCMIPQSVLAEVGGILDEVIYETILENDNEAASVDSASDYVNDIYAETALGEVVERRTATTKTFRMSDGTYVAADYRKQIHYTDENGLYVLLNSTPFSSFSI